MKVVSQPTEGETGLEGLGVEGACERVERENILGWARWALYDSRLDIRR